ncbi:MAG: beta-galactosidase [Kiritimatiellae bacterium]|nr:beta-galactosidase [Kiritimatiellia bacterium]
MKKIFTLSVLGVALLSAMPSRAGNEGLSNFGVAYYPEAWPETRWETDLELMKGLGINLIRIGEFNWSNFEKEEGVFDFAPYLRLLDLCSKHGIEVMMCTPTAATPKWMQADYPETEKTRQDGSQPACGIRQSSCVTSERFRFFSRRVVERMAEAFKNHPAVTWWQIDNELHIFGATGECCCKRCEQAYREDLKRRYGTLEKLNAEFNGCFWSARFTKWEDVRLPLDHRRPGWRRDYQRFLGEQFLSYALEHAEILRRANPAWRITSNNPSCSNFMRHDILYRDLGYASADTYCASTDPSTVTRNAWRWTMFRGLTGQQRAFMVGETGPFCFDTDNERSFEFVKPWFWMMVGYGAESVLYFRWRMSVSGEETHGAILPWNGRKTFLYDMIKKQMDEYRSLPVSIAKLPLQKSDVAIVHDADSHTSTLSYSVTFKKRDETMDTEEYLLYALERRGVNTDILQLAEDMDLERYKVVFFPLCLSVSPEIRAKIRNYVKNGGVAVAISRFNSQSPLGGYYYPEVYPVGETDLFGIEISERRSISWGSVELAEMRTAEALLSHKTGCFKGAPLLTRNNAGQGAAYYCTRNLDENSAIEVCEAVLKREGFKLGEALPKGVVRKTRGDYVIIVNYTESEVSLPAEKGEVLFGDLKKDSSRMVIPSLGVVAVKGENSQK